ncbi:MAG: TIGR00645 family protein [Rhodobacter sp.]|nr:TIGR00645 family protein [Rhodobacter sp.]
MSDKPVLERRFEQALFASRWIMAPMYLGLVVTLAMLAVVFLRELAYYVPQVMQMSADKTILVILTLIDLTLAANLLLIVLFSGYENFVSKLDLEDGGDRPYWMGTVDFAGLKMKLIGSIVAISAIHLLKRFMEIGQQSADAIYGDTQLMWLVIIHGVFVASGVLMALMDWLSARSKSPLASDPSAR